MRMLSCTSHEDHTLGPDTVLLVFGHCWGLAEVLIWDLLLWGSSPANLCEGAH